MYKKQDEPYYGSLEVKVKYTSDDPEQQTKDLDKAISKFKKLVHKEGLIQEMKEREYFKSPGRKRYEKRRDFKYRTFLQKLKQERSTSRVERQVRKKYKKNEAKK